MAGRRNSSKASRLRAESRQRTAKVDAILASTKSPVPTAKAGSRANSEQRTAKLDAQRTAKVDAILAAFKPPEPAAKPTLSTPPATRWPHAFSEDPHTWAARMPLADLHDILNDIRYARSFWVGPTSREALERVVAMAPRIGEFVHVDQILSRALQADSLAAVFPELQQATDAMVKAIETSAASADEKAEAWLLFCARNAGADASVEAATYLARINKLPAEIIEDIAATWKAEILRDIARSQAPASIRDLAKSGTLSLLQAADTLRQPYGMDRGGFMSADHADSQIVDAAMLRAIEGLDLGAFTPWASARLDELSDGPEAFDHHVAAVWLFAMLRSDYALRSASADGLRTWVRAFSKGAYDRELPWRTLGQSGFETSNLIAAGFAFTSARVLGQRPSPKRDAAAQVLLSSQDSQGYWSSSISESGKETIRHPLHTTCCAVHALAVVRPVGWARACERAARWIAAQQDSFGYWSDKAGSPEYLTVLALDSLRLASGQTPITFNPAQTPSAADDEASIAAKALRLGPQPRIIKFLDSGTEADVYLVEDRFKRRVAAKVFFESKRIPEHMYNHAIGLARVPHDAVAELYSIEDVLDQEGQPLPAILMELLEGEELEDRLRREVSLAELIDWGRTLCELFAAMHKVDHVHRDAHAGNFFVTDRGLRLYDVLNSPSAQNRSPESLAALKRDNALQVRAIIKAMFEKLPRRGRLSSEAGEYFAAQTSKSKLTLEAVRAAFGEAIEMMKKPSD